MEKKLTKYQKRFWNNNNRFNIHIIGIPEEEKRMEPKEYLKKQ